MFESAFIELIMLLAVSACLGMVVMWLRQPLIVAFIAVGSFEITGVRVKIKDTQGEFTLTSIIVCNDKSRIKSHDIQQIKCIKSKLDPFYFYLSKNNVMSESKVVLNEFFYSFVRVCST